MTLLQKKREQRKNNWNVRQTKTVFNKEEHFVQISLDINLMSWSYKCFETLFLIEEALQHCHDGEGCQSFGTLVSQGHRRLSGKFCHCEYRLTGLDENKYEQLTRFMDLPDLCCKVHFNKSLVYVVVKPFHHWSLNLTAILNRPFGWNKTITLSSPSSQICKFSLEACTTCCIALSLEMAKKGNRAGNPPSCN